MARTYIAHEREISLYDADKKKLIGVFRTPTLSGRYLFKNTSSNKSGNRIITALRTKSKICNGNRVDCKVAVRYANEDQIKLLGDNDVFIKDGYQTMAVHEMKGYDSSRMQLAKDGCEILEKLRSERRRVNENNRIV